MIKRKQLYRHDPDNGVHGDCYRTAVACLLGMEPYEVPHFAEGLRDDSQEDGAEMNRRAERWLRNQGLALLSVAFDDDLDNLLSVMGQMNAGVPWLLTGLSRTGVNHNVICVGGEIVWDPSLDDAGIVGPSRPEGLYWCNALVRI